MELSREQTARLLEAGVGVRELMLVALGRCLREWSGAARVNVDVEGHGREEIGTELDISRTVGWFTTISPVSLQRGQTTELDEEIERLRRVPRNGIGYGLLRYLSGRSELGERHSEVAFNYLGQFDQVFAAGGPFWPAEESAGPTQAADLKRVYVFEINGKVTAGVLRFGWTYSRNLHRRETVEYLAARLSYFLSECAQLHAAQS